MQKISVADIEPLVNEYKGNVAAIARKLGVNRSTVWVRVQESVTLKAALEDARETMIDNAESKLYSKILDGDMTAIIFFLKTQGRSRGYVEKQEVEHTGKDGGAIKHEDVGQPRNDEDTARRVLALFDRARARTAEPPAVA